MDGLAGGPISFVASRNRHATPAIAHRQRYCGPRGARTEVDGLSSGEKGAAAPPLLCLEVCCAQG